MVRKKSSILVPCLVVSIVIVCVAIGLPHAAKAGKPSYKWTAQILEGFDSTLSSVILEPGANVSVDVFMSQNTWLSPEGRVVTDISNFMFEVQQGAQSFQKIRMNFPQLWEEDDGELGPYKFNGLASDLLGFLNYPDGHPAPGYQRIFFRFFVSGLFYDSQDVDSSFGAHMHFFIEGVAPYSADCNACEIGPDSVQGDAYGYGENPPQFVVLTRTGLDTWEISVDTEFANPSYVDPGEWIEELGCRCMETTIRKRTTYQFQNTTPSRGKGLMQFKVLFKRSPR